MGTVVSLSAREITVSLDRFELTAGQFPDDLHKTSRIGQVWQDHIRASLPQLLLRGHARGNADDHRAAFKRGCHIPFRVAYEHSGRWLERDVVLLRCLALGGTDQPRAGDIIRTVATYIEVKNLRMMPQKAKLGLGVWADVPSQNRLHNAGNLNDSLKGVLDSR